MDQYKKIMHGSTSAVYINGERDVLATKIEVKMTGDFEDMAFCGEDASFPEYNGYAIEGTITDRKADSRLELAIVEGYRTGIMPDIVIMTSLGRRGSAGPCPGWCSPRWPWPTSRPRRAWSVSCPLRRSMPRIWRRSNE